MLSGRFLLAVLVITTAISFVQWFFTGFLFHKYQSSTPATWRKESGRSYAASVVISLIFAFVFTTIIYVWKARYGVVSFTDGIKFGIICWATFSVTIEAGNAVYVNYSSKFVVGKCLSALVEYMIAGAVGAAFL